MDYQDRWGILGGTFDPPHIGHLMLAEAAREHFKLKRVLFVPTGDPPYKTSATHAPHRVAMTELATADHPLFYVDRREVCREGSTYTCDTIRELCAEHKGFVEWYFVVGADQLAELGDWRNIDYCVRHARFVAADRASVKAVPPAGFEQWVRTFPAFPSGVSSTRIREMVRRGESVRYAVPPTVEGYIRKYGLYRS